MSDPQTPLIYYDIETIPQKCHAVYNNRNSPDYLNFGNANEWPSNFDGVVKNIYDETLLPPYCFLLETKAKADDLLKYDCLPNTFDSFLVDEKALQVLRGLCSKDFQILEPTIIKAKDGTLSNYKLLNILKFVDSIDTEKSWCLYSEDGSLRSVNNLFFKSGCMGDIHIARDKYLKSMVLVSQELAAAFRASKIKGAKFVSDRERVSNVPFPEEYLQSIFFENPEAAKRYFVSQLNTTEDYEFFKTRVHKIPREILEKLIEMTLSRSSFHAKECAELMEIINKVK